MLDLVHYHSHNQIVPSTAFRIGNFKEISDFSSTTLFGSDDAGVHGEIRIPSEYFPFLIERNTRVFAQKVSNLGIGNLSEESLYESLNPLTNGPLQVIIFIDSLFGGRYKDINFDLPKFIGGWGRQFQDEGYKAFEILVEGQVKECTKDTSFMDRLQDLVLDLHHGLLIQRFLEGDEERYLSNILELDSADGQDIHKVYNRLRECIKNTKNSTEKKLLWRAIQYNMQNSSLSPVNDILALVNSKIRLDFLDGVKNLGAEKVLDMIINDSIEGLYLMKVIDTFPVEEYASRFEALTYALDIPPKRKKIEYILRTISVEYVVIIFDKAKGEKEKKYLLGICKIQLKEIYARVTSGDTVLYARIIHFIASGKSADTTDIFFGISKLLISENKGITHKGDMLLPHKKLQSIASRVRGAVTDLVHSKTTGGVIQSKIIGAVTSGAEYKESLLYDFQRDFYPIGAKIHFLEPIIPEQVALLHQIVGFGSTPFKLLHADTSLCLPACQSPMQLIAILHRLMELGIISDDTLELQLTMAGRVPNEMAGIIGSVCLFSKIQPTSYPRSTFVTSHNGETGTCIMCYDAGVLYTHNFPNLPPHISGRTDMLGFKNPTEAITYFLVSNLVSQYVHGSPLSSIGERFIHEYRGILQAHGIVDILQAKWVHNPDKENTPVEEEEHYMVVKACTDILGKDIEDYSSHSNASGLSFAVKNLLYKYIIQHKLLPLNQEWAKKYLSYFKYEQEHITSL